MAWTAWMRHSDPCGMSFAPWVYVKGIILELGGIMAKIHQILLRMRAFSIHHHPGQGMFASLRIRLRHFRTSFLWLIYRSYQTWMEEHLTAFMICWKIDPFSAIIFPWKSSNFCSCQFWLPEGSTYLMFTRLEGIGMTAWPSRAQKLDFRPLPHQQASVSGNERYWCWEVEIDHPMNHGSFNGENWSPFYFSEWRSER